MHADFVTDAGIGAEQTPSSAYFPNIPGLPAAGTAKLLFAVGSS
jgi:hypothetical protein